ncbi:MAG: hypothetical protein AABW58_01105 [Nanoarchaeota archaeon]
MAKRRRTVNKKVAVNQAPSRKLNLGHFFFSLGILLVILFTIADPNQLNSTKGAFLLLLGAVVGFLDVDKREAPYFLLASLGLIIASATPVHIIEFLNIGNYLRAALLNTAIFLSLAVVMVSLKIIYRIYLESK